MGLGRQRERGAGDNSTTTRKVPQLVAGLSNVVAVAAGTSHSLALTAGGTVHAFGDNLYGQIGDATTTDRRTPVALSLTNVTTIAAGDYHSMALRSNGDVFVWGRNNAGQIGNGTTTGEPIDCGRDGRRPRNSADARRSGAAGASGRGMDWA